METTWRSWRTWWEITFNYEPDLVAAIKDSVFVAAREWCPDERCWKVADVSIRACFEAMAKACPGMMAKGITREDLELRMQPREHKAWTNPHNFTGMPPPGPQAPEDPDEALEWLEREAKEKQEQARKEEARKQAQKEREARYAQEEEGRRRRRAKEAEDARKREEARQQERRRRYQEQQDDPFSRFFRDNFGGGGKSNELDMAGALDTFLQKLPRDMTMTVARAIRAAIHPDRHGGKHVEISQKCADVLDKHK